MEALYSHKLDADAYQALESLPANPFHRFVRQDVRTLEAQREAFELHGHSPLFTYPEADQLNVDTYLEAVDKIVDLLPKLCHHNVLIEDLYAQKLDELRIRALLVQAIQQRDDQTVTNLSENLFSSSEQTRQELEKELKETLSTDTTFVAHAPTVSRKTFIEMVSTILQHYSMDEWIIGTCKGTSIKIKHGHHGSAPKILIPKTLHLAKNRAMRLLAHEVEVHALRTTNGRDCPLLLLGRGLDRYIDTEEGLAIYFQRLTKSTSLHRAPGFWDGYATVLTKDLPFSQVYETLKDARTAVARRAGNREPEKKGREAAWRLCLRAYRGIHQTGQAGVGYRRDHIYRSGLARVTRALSENPDTLLPILFIGNMGLQHVERVKRLGLMPGTTPQLIARDVVQSFT